MESRLITQENQINECEAALRMRYIIDLIVHYDITMTMWRNEEFKTVKQEREEIASKLEIKEEELEKQVCTYCWTDYYIMIK